MSGAGASPPTRPRTRLTGAGWVFCGLAAILTLGAIRVQVPLLYLLVGGMFGCLLASVLLGRRMVRYIDLQREAPSRVWQNQTVHVGYYLRNTRRGACLGLTLCEQVGPAVRSARGYLACLGSRQAARAGGRFRASHRGQLVLGEVEVSSDFPFALTRSRRRIDRPLELLVWPSRGHLKRPLLHRGAVEVSTSAPSPVGGGSDDFFGLRDYRGGDNPRWIHWRRSAGRNVPVMREMSRPVPELLYVLLDTRADPADLSGLQRLERMIRFTATLVDYAISRDYQVGLALGDHGGPVIVPAQPGRGQLHKLLDCLALAQAGSHGLEQVVAGLHRGQLRYAQVVLVSGTDELSAAVWIPLRKTCRHLTLVRPSTLGLLFDDSPAPADPASTRRGAVRE